MALTKDNITKSLMDSINVDKQTANMIVTKFFVEIVKALKEGQEVKLSGFGKFHLLDKKPRIGRNPKTGESKIIKARRVVSFKSSQHLKNRISRNLDIKYLDDKHILKEAQESVARLKGVL